MKTHRLIVTTLLATSVIGLGARLQAAVNAASQVTGGGTVSAAAHAAGNTARVVPPAAIPSRPPADFPSRPNRGPAEVTTLPKNSSAAARANASGLTVAADATANASARLERNAARRELRSLSFETRARGTEAVEGRLEASAQAMTSLQERAAELDGRARARADRALAEVAEKRAEVNARLDAYRSASKEDFKSVRNDLAKSYDAYARAVANAEVAVDAGS